MHRELTLRGTTLLGPESPAMGRRSAKSAGAAASLYIYVENVDKVVEKATKLCGTSQAPIMFWGDAAAGLSILMAVPGWSGRTSRSPRRRK
jgi:uncharacterized glyoxalase superfamily protein PhnB